jgi:hypothetical protein
LPSTVAASRPLTTARRATNSRLRCGTIASAPRRDNRGWALSRPTPRPGLLYSSSLWNGSSMLHRALPVGLAGDIGVGHVHRRGRHALRHLKSRRRIRGRRWQWSSLISRTRTRPGMPPAARPQQRIGGAKSIDHAVYSFITNSGDSGVRPVSKPQWLDRKTLVNKTGISPS